MGVIELFRDNPKWGNYATGLVNGKFQTPRAGQGDDNAHPPITPMKSLDPASIADPTERNVYAIVVKHFLACCSRDGVGEQVRRRRGERKRASERDDLRPPLRSCTSVRPPTLASLAHSFHPLCSHCISD